MAFKKIDLDAVDELDPFDQFVTKRVEENNTATWRYRARVGHKTWVSPRPKYGCANTHTFLPCAFPTSGRTQTIHISWLIKAGGNSDRNIYIRPCVYSPERRACYPSTVRPHTADPSEIIAPTASPVTVTTEYIIPAGAPRTVFLGLHIVSDWDADGVSATKTNYTAPHSANLLALSDGYFSLDAPFPDTTPPWTTYDPDKRYAFRVTTHSGGADSDAPQFAAVFDVLRADGTPGTNLGVLASPTAFSGDTPTGDFAIDWRELAWVEFHSFAAYEVVEEPTAEVGLEVGWPTNFNKVGSLYRRQRDVYATGGAPRCVSSQEDIFHTDVDSLQVNRHGCMVSCNDRTWRPLGAAFLWQTGTEGRFELGGNVSYRNRFRVEGLVAVGSIRRVSGAALSVGADMQLRFRAVTDTRDPATGEWNNGVALTLPNTDANNTTVVVPIQQPNYNGDRDLPLAFSDYIATSVGSYQGGNYDPVYHNLRGTWPTSAITNPLLSPDTPANRLLTPGGCGLTYFSFDISDEYLDDELRLMRLEVRGDFYTWTNSERLWVGTWVYIPCWTVRPLEEVQP
jgi:hypothetical protein